ncbi:MAG: stage II sporulation protein P [Clostridia bacterium]|nr:stage II sporulation protein P [Clostridia bacterium]
MKVTVAILNKGIKSIEKIITNIFLTVFSVLMIVLLCFFISNIYMPPIFLNFGTNFRQADNIDLSISKIVLKYPLYNSKNYKINLDMDRAQNNETVKTNNENVDKIQALDAMVSSEKLQEIEVMAKSQDINLNITDSADVQRISLYNMKLLNYSSKRQLDFNAMFSKVITLTKKSDKILIYDTHTSESYANSDKYKFDYTGVYRTTDANYNMLKVAAEFQKNLSEKSFQAVQDTTPHDYGTYTSAYSKSRITVKNQLKSMGGVGISIDLHRDATSDLTFRPMVKINGVEVAQCMFVIGVGTDTLNNPYWEDNLSLALQLQKIADKVYPGLFRPMIIRNSVYNQDLNKFSILIEVGATGNTIDETLLATRCLTNVLNILYKN